MTAVSRRGEVHVDASWASDPTEEMVAILLSQALWASPSPPPVYLDFWTSAYQAIGD